MKAVRQSSGIVAGVFLWLLSVGSSGAVAVTSSSAGLANGKLLVASRHLADPNFAESVILLIEYSEKGALGLVINRGSRMPLYKVLPQIDQLRGREDKLFLGGPVMRRQVVLLVQARQPPLNAPHVFGDIYFSRSLRVLHHALTHDGEKFRAYSGYAGWGAGQLDAEVTSGDWFVTEPDEHNVFSLIPASVWPALIARFEGQWANERTLRRSVGSAIDFSRRDRDEPVFLGDPGGQAAAPDAACIDGTQTLTADEAAHRPMAADDDAIAAVEVIPWSPSRGGRSVLCRHRSVGVAVSHPGEELEVGIVEGQVSCGEAAFERGGYGFRITPPGVKPRVHDDEVVPLAHQSLASKPSEELLAVGSFENVRERVAVAQPTFAGGDGEQVEIVVPDHAVAANLDHAAQGASGSRPPVDEVTDEMQLVQCRIVGEGSEEIVQLVGTSLKVADEYSQQASSASVRSKFAFASFCSTSGPA